MTEQIEAKFNVYGYKKLGDEFGGISIRVNDDEAQFWSVYEMDGGCEDHFLFKCYSREDAEWAASDLNFLYKDLTQAQTQLAECRKLISDLKKSAGSVKMIIEIGDKYIVEGGQHDFILYEKRIVQNGKTAGQETKARIGYYAKLDQLIRSLITHDAKHSDVQSIQAMEQHISRIALQCEKAFCGGEQ